MSSIKNKNFHEDCYSSCYNFRNELLETEDAEIINFMNKYVVPVAGQNSVILNATYADNVYQLSVVNGEIAYLPKNNVESSGLTFSSNKTYDIVICSGNLLNDADPMEVFERFSRIVRSNGLFVLKFQNSNALELIFTQGFNKKAVYVSQKGWHYSDCWIGDLLAMNKFEVIKRHRFNFSSRHLKFPKEKKKLSIFSFPFFQKLPSNTILLCQKC